LVHDWCSKQLGKSGNTKAQKVWNLVRALKIYLIHKLVSNF